MQKNWYIIYTKPKCEKKVATLFTKRRIQNFFAVNSKQSDSFRKRKWQQEPLFDSYLFANIAENELNRIKSLDGVLNIVFWKGKPATVQDDEIEAIKEFTTDYQNIRLEKTSVNLEDVVRIIDRPKYSVDGNLITLKNTTVKVNLPSLGYTMVAELDSKQSIGKEIPFGHKEFQLQS